MIETEYCPLAATLAAQLREEREGLVTRWLERIADRVEIPASQVFPTEELLDHVPILIDGIANYIEDPADEITAEAPVVAKAMELGELRHAQGFDAYQILKEYEILGGVLFHFLVTTVDEIEQECTRGELLTCAHRLFRAISVIQQYTTVNFLQRADERVRERENRLRSFNRAVSHELKNRLGAVGGAADILSESWVGGKPDQVAKFSSIITRNVGSMRETLESLIELTKMDVGIAEGRNITLPEAAAEAVRELREFALSRHVEVEIADDMPRVEVPAAVVELALANYISNAIKYRNPDAGECWVRIDAEIRRVEDGSASLIVRVRDNGLGVPEEAHADLFNRFFRAHETVTGEEGSGLGLSIVKEAVEAAGGRAWAEFPDQGSVFAFSLPDRKDASHFKGDPIGS